MKCQWFALCENKATLTIPHPILGNVPACERCKRIYEGEGVKKHENLRRT